MREDASKNRLAVPPLWRNPMAARQVNETLRHPTESVKELLSNAAAVGASATTGTVGALWRGLRDRRAGC